MNKFKLIPVAVASVLAASLHACSGQSVEEIQILSQSNAIWNAQRFLAAKLPGADYVEFQSDSTIDAQCKFGDGWASGQALANGGKVVEELKCQTNGSSKGIKGCFIKADFEEKPKYFNQEGECDKSIKKMVDLSQKDQ